MNKAFVKDDDTLQDPEIELDPRADIPAGSRNYMTPRGMRRLRDKLDDLVQHSRLQLPAAINRLTRDGSGRSGDFIKVHTPPGGQELEIVEVCYREINYSFFLALTVSSL